MFRRPLRPLSDTKILATLNCQRSQSSLVRDLAALALARAEHDLGTLAMSCPVPRPITIKSIQPYSKAADPVKWAAQLLRDANLPDRMAVYAALILDQPDLHEKVIEHLLPREVEAVKLDAAIAQQQAKMEAQRAEKRSAAKAAKAVEQSAAAELLALQMAAIQAFQAALGTPTHTTVSTAPTGVSIRCAYAHRAAHAILRGVPIEQIAVVPSACAFTIDAMRIGNLADRIHRADALITEAIAAVRSYAATSVVPLTIDHNISLVVTSFKAQALFATSGALVRGRLHLALDADLSPIAQIPAAIDAEQAERAEAAARQAALNAARGPISAKRMEARFAGTCACCGEAFDAGDTIFYRKGTGAWCASHGEHGTAAPADAIHTEQRIIDRGEAVPVVGDSTGKGVINRVVRGRWTDGEDGDGNPWDVGWHYTIYYRAHTAEEKADYNRRCQEAHASRVAAEASKASEKADMAAGEAACAVVRSRYPIAVNLPQDAISAIIRVSVHGAFIITQGPSALIKPQVTELRSPMGVAYCEAGESGYDWDYVPRLLCASEADRDALVAESVALVGAPVA